MISWFPCVTRGRHGLTSPCKALWSHSIPRRCNDESKRPASWFAAAVSFACLMPPLKAQGSVTLVSLSSNQEQGDQISRYPSCSVDGRVVAFDSQAGNFAAGDTNGGFDVYVRYLDTGETVWVSPMADGSAGYFGSYEPVISADGRMVVFYSVNNLVPGDSGFGDVFVRDLISNTTIRASVSQSGGQPNGDSYPATISGDGRFVAFLSLATNLIPNDKNGGHFNFGRDVFVRDLASDATELVHLSSTGIQGNLSASGFGLGMSVDGKFVVFGSMATNLVPGDTNGTLDVFMRDRFHGKTTRISVDSFGIQANKPSGQGAIGVSADGRFVVFSSEATNLVPGDTNGFEDIFVHDRQTAKTTRVNVSSTGTQANDWSFGGSISADGRYVAFGSLATSLVPGDVTFSTDVFLHDRSSGTTHRVSISSSGEPGNHASPSLALSPDGRHLAYSSIATNLVPGDSNSWMDVFLAQLGSLAPAVYCTATINSQGCMPSMSWSGSASFVPGRPFELRASNIVPHRNGMLTYGTTGPAATPFQGGTLCLSGPVSRCSTLDSGGSTPCSGNFVYDFNAFIQSGVDPALIISQSVWTQYWSRDPQSPSLANLTDAVYFVIDP